MTIDNASFETAEPLPSSTGRALSWSAQSVGQFFDFAVFSLGPNPNDLGTPRETFEEDWPGTGDTPATPATFVGFASFNVGVNQTLFEGFELNWAVGTEVELQSSEFAEFGTATFDSFEISWGDILHSFVGFGADLEYTTLSDGERIEWFESGWFDLEAILSTSVSAIFGRPSAFPVEPFYIGNPLTAPYEMFWLQADIRVVSVDISTDQITLENPPTPVGTSNRVAFKFLEGAEGQFPGGLPTNGEYIYTNTGDHETGVFSLKATNTSTASAIDITSVGFGDLYLVGDDNIFWLTELTGIE